MNKDRIFTILIRDKGITVFNMFEWDYNLNLELETNGKLTNQGRTKGKVEKMNHLTGWRFKLLKYVLRKLVK